MLNSKIRYLSINKIYQIYGFIALFFSESVFAVTHPTIGEVAKHLNQGSSLLVHFLHFVCVVMGIMFIIMALSFYKAHRENPKFVPMERPIAYFFLGLILISLPFLGQFFQGKTGDPNDEKKRGLEKAHSIRDIDAPLEH